jgi:NadR type nicotinamide-nucleotide adenylyltransferase
MTTGLTLGKFAPLHQGHQLLFETARKEVDKLIVVIYETDVTDIPLRVRAGWIRALYPDVMVIEARGGPKGYSHEREYQIREEHFIRSLIGDIRITHFYSSEFYGDHMSRFLNAIDRRVDEARRIVPVSATMIRSDPFTHRRFLSPTVYRDMITSAVFMGAPSTGKSTIVEALAQRYNTTFASEYGRDYWAAHQIDRRIPLESFDEIAIGHIEREDIRLRDANRYFFVDTNAITTYMFSLDYHGRAPELLTRIAHENASRYDLFFLCCDDIPYDDTWDRSGDVKRHAFQQQIIDDLNARGIPYIELRGDLNARISQVESVLSSYRKYPAAPVKE